MVALFMAITILTSSGNAFAQDWGMTLRPYCLTGGESQNNRIRDVDFYTSRVFLTEIVGGNSYYIRAQTVNAEGSIRTGLALCSENGGWVNFPNDSMAHNYRYWLEARNDYWDTNSRWATGGLEW